MRVVEHAAAIGLLGDGEACAGAWVLGHDELVPVRARMTLLATGGAGALYSRTTNPPGATGDGIALAHRAGAARARTWSSSSSTRPRSPRAGVPSSSRRPCAARALISSRPPASGSCPPSIPTPSSRRATSSTRVLQARLERGQTSFLSLRHLDAATVRRRFPNLVEGCARLGIDLCSDPVPVAPAAHYLMGGIATDLDGATNLAGLYASGESACTGAHGANRLASNSLLECFVFAHRAVSAGLDARRPGRARRPAPGASARPGPARRSCAGGCGPGPARCATARASRSSLAWLDGQPESNPVARRRADRVRRPRAAREPRGASAARLSPTPIRPWRRPRHAQRHRRRRDRARARRGSRHGRRHHRGDRPRRRCGRAAAVVVKAAGVVCGLAELLACVRLLDPDAEMELLAADGDVMAAPAARRSRASTARAHAVLTAERTGLNLRAADVGHRDRDPAPTSRPCGHAASRSSTRARRRPGCGSLDKRAVACGGGRNHRMGLDDAILIKDNHVAIAGGIAPAIEAARAANPDLAIEVEVDDLDQLDEARRRRRRHDPARQHGSAASCARPSPAPRAAPGSRPRAASRSTPSAPSPRPASTRSRSGPSPTR